MTSEQIEDLLARVEALHRSEADPELRAVRTALLVEDAFGVTLSDEEIDPAELGDTSTIRRLLARHGVSG